MHLLLITLFLIISATLQAQVVRPPQRCFDHEGASFIGAKSFLSPQVTLRDVRLAPQTEYDRWSYAKIQIRKRFIGNVKFTIKCTTMYPTSITCSGRHGPKHYFLKIAKNDGEWAGTLLWGQNDGSRPFFSWLPSIMRFKVKRVPAR